MASLTSFRSHLLNFFRLTRFLSNSATRWVTQCPISTSPHVRDIFDIKDNDDFAEKVMSSSQTVVVNFHADWCEPCRILSPKLEELISPLTNVHLAKIDVEKTPEFVQTFEVKAIPAVIAVKNGQVIDKFLGLVDIESVENFVKKLSSE